MPRGADDKDADKPIAPGWYPDPWSATGEGERYYDGKRWGSTARPLARHTRTPSPPETSITSIKSGKRKRALKRVRAGNRFAGMRRSWRPIAILVALVTVAYALPKLRDSHHSSTSAIEQTTPATVADRPAPSKEEAATPLGVPAPAPAGKGGFEVLRHQLGQPAIPVAWDPCRPIHYVVNPVGAPADGSLLIHSAIARVQTATGLQFIDDGTTTEKPDKQRDSYLPDRYNSTRWAPVLFAWSNENAYPELAGYIDGLGSANAEYLDRKTLVDVSGEVVLDRDDLSIKSQPDRGVVRATILHEIGHLVGLDHTPDPRQIMYSESRFNVRDFAPGDLRGLALLGSQLCYPGI
jgi:hypothetical protein